MPQAIDAALNVSRAIAAHQTRTARESQRSRAAPSDGVGLARRRARGVSPRQVDVRRAPAKGCAGWASFAAWRPCCRQRRGRGRHVRLAAAATSRRRRLAPGREASRAREMFDLPGAERIGRARRFSPRLAFHARAGAPPPRLAPSLQGRDAKRIGQAGPAELRTCDGCAPRAAWRGRARSDRPPIHGTSALRTSREWPTLRASRSRW